MQLLKELFEAQFDPQDLLQSWKKKAWDRFEELGWPHSKKEAFQYIPTSKLSFSQCVTPPLESFQNTDQTLVFTDGYFQSHRLPSPLVCLSLDRAIRSYGVFLQNRMTRCLKEETDPFAALNGAFQGKGAFLYVPPHTILEQPLELLHLLTQSELANSRIHMYIGRGSKLTLSQTIQETTKASFLNSLIDVVLDENAEFTFLTQDSLSCESRSLQAIRILQKKESRSKVMSLSKGSSLSRLSVRVQLLEENSSTYIQGLSQLEGERQHHAHVFVEHIAPDCQSNQHFKQVLYDRSRGSFEGKIFVHSKAQKTESYQKSATLLLSPHAAMYAKPNLEIFADDVKASHGATIGQLDPEQLFYLLSRGLNRQDAERWLIQGFCADMELNSLLDANKP